MKDTIIKKTRKDYTVALKNYLALVKGNPAIEAIYQIGGINNPGISDIDLIIVIKENAGKKDVEKLSIKCLKRKDQYVFLHEPVIINNNILEKINNFLPLYKCKYIYGKRKEIPKQNKKQKLFHLIDMILLYYPRNILSIYVNKNINTRDALCLLFLLGYNLAVCSEITKKNSKKYLDFKKKTILLRKKWFSLEKLKYIKLDNLIEQGHNLCYDMIEDMAGYLGNEQCKDSVFFSQEHSIIFQKNWQKEKAKKQAILYYKKTKITASFLPCVYRRFLNRQICGNIDKNYKKKKECIEMQIKLYERYGSICKTIGCTIPLSVRVKKTRDMIKIQAKKALHILYKNGLL